jgi:hypothetical protein
MMDQTSSIEAVHIRRPFQRVFAALENDYTARRITSSAVSNAAFHEFAISLAVLWKM